MRNDQLENIWNELEQAKKAGDLDTQIEITQNLLSVAQQRADGPAELEMLRQLGNLYQEKGDLRKAHSYRVIAAELAAQSADHLSPSLRAHIENDLGRSFLEAKDWNRAAIHLQHSLKLIEEEPNENVRRLNRAIIQVNYTLVLANQDKLPDALKLAESIEKDAEELQ